MGTNTKAKIKVILTNHLTNTPFPPPFLSSTSISEVFDYYFPKFETDAFSIFFFSFFLDFGQLRVSRLGLDPKLTLM